VIGFGDPDDAGSHGDDGARHRCERRGDAGRSPVGALPESVRRTVGLPLHRPSVALPGPILRPWPLVRRMLRDVGWSVLWMLLPAAAVYLDTVVLARAVSEVSITEGMQLALAGLIGLRFLDLARRDPSSRGFFVILAGLFGVIVVRELDFLFDAIPFVHWSAAAGIIATLSLRAALAATRGSFVRPLAGFVGSAIYHRMLVGGMALAVFSRSFGSGGLLWQDLLGEAYSAGFKSAIQEGLELFAYAVLAHAVVDLRLSRATTGGRWRGGVVAGPASGRDVA